MKERDEHKKMICERDGITLVVIPYWWNKTIESVAHTLHSIRPDVLIPASLLNGKPIPVVCSIVHTKCKNMLILFN